MAAIAEEERIHGIAQVLVSEGLIDKEKAIQLQKQAHIAHVSILTYICNNKIVDNNILVTTIANSFGLSLFNLDVFDIDCSPLNLVNDKLIKRHLVLPLYTRGNTLYVAMDDPSKAAALKEIQFHTGLHTFAVVVDSLQLQETIEKVLNANKSQGIDEFTEDNNELGELEFSTADEENDSEMSQNSTDDAPVVKFINKIILDAIKHGASDIHFEPYEREYRIRYRQDGVLQEVSSPPISLASRITARIKIMSNLDISERRVPQDGRFKMKLSKASAIDFRVSTCPTVGGEKIVMRILDQGSTKIGVEALGFSPFQKENFIKAIERPQGMILVTGPTGSGKTVTLYTALTILNTKENNISTVEDPVEIKIPGINQVNINPKAGLTFSSTLRAFLRQDPDIIMVGEIRDLETAEISIKAAQTGHLVLSTLHTNSAAETLTRLVNMGIPSFNIASSVNLIVAQRLGRKLCPKCRVLRDDITPKSLVELGFSEADSKEVKLYKAVGCNECTNGYRGRMGLFEVMPITKTIAQLIMQNANSLDILKQAQLEGMLTIYQSGLALVKEGITTIEEVNRVTVE